jgi:hypothetical protein
VEAVMKRLMVLLAAVLLCVAIVRIAGQEKSSSAASIAGSGNVIETAATAAQPLPRQPTSYGVNLFSPAYWSNERAFMNLAAGGAWRSIHTNWSDFDPARIDRFGTILSLNPGENVALALTKPPAAFRGDVAVRCTYQGKGVVAGVGMSGLHATPGRLDFIWQKDNLTSHFRIDATDPADPIRNIDCREANADPKALFDPAFVNTLRAFKSVRFMDWQQSNANMAGNWAQRTPPQATIQASMQGVAIEHMVTLANLAKFDPWFVLPWKSEPNYVENFARYVHDHLEPGRTAYIEVGNEIWNNDFPASRQALAEGQVRNLGKTEPEARMRRYGQRSVEVFKVWERVFADNPKRIVRILSGQNAWPEPILYALDFQDTAAHVDALASALYFGQDMMADPATDTSNLTPLFAKLNASITDTYGTARRFKKIADSRGLRFLGYEGGQHVSYAGPDVAFSGRLNRDPRMGEAFRIFLAGWDRDFGDLLLIYHLTSPIGRSASFGLREYSGQPIAETPKLKALIDAIAATKSVPAR